MKRPKSSNNYLDLIVELQNKITKLGYIVVPTNFNGIAYIDSKEKILFVNANIDTDKTAWLIARHSTQILNGDPIADIEYFDPSNPKKCDLETYNLLKNSDYPLTTVLENGIFDNIKKFISSNLSSDNIAVSL